MNGAETPALNVEQENRSFYYALYYTLTHWTGALTILVLMVTAGVILSATQTPTIHPKTATAAFAFLWITELYLAYRIMILGKYVRSKIPDSTLKGPHLMGLAPAISSTLAVAWNLWILWR